MLELLIYNFDEISPQTTNRLLARQFAMARNIFAIRG